MEKIARKYVIQRADGQFYYRKGVSSAWGFTDDFGRASLFESERGAKSRLDIAGEGARIRRVSVSLLPDPDDIIYIPSVWCEDDIKKSPSKCSWASIDDDGNYSSGSKCYDADGNEITEEEYEALVGPTQD